MAKALLLYWVCDYILICHQNFSIVCSLKFVASLDHWIVFHFRFVTFDRNGILNVLVFVYVLVCDQCDAIILLLTMNIQSVCANTQFLRILSHAQRLKCVSSSSKNFLSSNKVTNLYSVLLSTCVCTYVFFLNI